MTFSGPSFRFHPNYHFVLTQITKGYLYSCYEGTDSKYFQLCRPYSPCCNYSPLLLVHESSHKQSESEQVYLCSNKTLFSKTCGRLDLAHRA